MNCDQTLFGYSHKSLAASAIWFGNTSFYLIFYRI